MKYKKMTSLAALLVATGLLAACADMSGVAGSEAKLREAASVGLPADASAAKPQPALRADWWIDFGDADLSALITQALTQSPSLKIAEARLNKALSVVDLSKSALLPTVGLDVQATRQLFTKNSIYPPPLGGNIYTMGTAQFEAGWEIDFFGKNKAALDAAVGAAKAAEADTQAARILLASNIARSWFQLARLNAQLEVANRTLAQREAMLGLVRQRVAAGLDTSVELRTSEGGLPEVRQQIEALQEQVQLTKNAIAALAGDPRLAQSLPAAHMSKALDLPQTLPANLLGVRPDIVAARWRVEASSREVASSKSQFYPNVNLMAFAGFSSIGLGNLHDASSSQWGVGPAIRLPIFEGGKLRANLRAKNADLDAAIESYNSSLIDAVRDVADQVASSQSIARQAAQQGQTEAAVQAAYDLAVQRYNAGISNYLQVLAAETALLNQRKLGVDLAARALDANVALIRALGGGYMNAN